MTKFHRLAIMLTAFNVMLLSFGLAQLRLAVAESC
jgi:hypothetical protein